MKCIERGLRFAICLKRRSMSSLRLDSAIEIQQIWGSTRSVMTISSVWESEAVNLLFSFHGAWTEFDILKFTLHCLRMQWKVLSQHSVMNIECWLNSLELFSFESTRLNLVSTRLPSPLDFDSISFLVVTAKLLFVSYHCQCEFNLFFAWES